MNRDLLWSLKVLRPLAMQLVFGVLRGTALISVGCTAVYASALPRTLGELSDLANEVFAGTVTSIEYKPDPKAGVLTRVTFGAIQAAKSERLSRQITVTLAGGRLGNVTSYISGMPQFEVGKRYVVFAESSLGTAANSYNPIYGRHQGIYLVGPPGVRHEQVTDSRGRPLIGIIDGRAILLDPNIDENGQPRVQGIRPQRGKPRPPLESDMNGKKVAPGGHIVRVETRAMKESAGIDSLPLRARNLGVRGREGGWYITPIGLDPGVRMTEREFLAAIRGMPRR